MNPLCNHAESASEMNSPQVAQVHVQKLTDNYIKKFARWLNANKRVSHQSYMILYWYLSLHGEAAVLCSKSQQFLKPDSCRQNKMVWKHNQLDPSGFTCCYVATSVAGFSHSSELKFYSTSKIQPDPTEAKVLAWGEWWLHLASLAQICLIRDVFQQADPLITLQSMVKLSIISVTITTRVSGKGNSIPV